VADLHCLRTKNRAQRTRSRPSGVPLARAGHPHPPHRTHLRRAGRGRPGANGPLRGHSPGESRTRDFSPGPPWSGPRTRERRLCGTASHGAASERRRSAFKSSCGGPRRGGQMAVKRRSKRAAWSRTFPRRARVSAVRGSVVSGGGGGTHRAACPAAGAAAERAEEHGADAPQLERNRLPRRRPPRASAHRAPHRAARAPRCVRLRVAPAGRAARPRARAGARGRARSGGRRRLRGGRTARSCCMPCAP
jgi:hypothetical protein